MLPLRHTAKSRLDPHEHFGRPENARSHEASSLVRVPGRARFHSSAIACYKTH
ncbi:MAG: hypothetical protein ABSF69_18300 [Polyangiaceae bacterium]